jgi:integrase
MALAVYPAKIIPMSPLPRGFLPSLGTPKALQYLYPDEDVTLLGAPEVPLSYRVLFGFLDREGLRAGEAQQLRWSDLDLDRGAIALDENKTDDPRSWALDPGVCRALQAWRDDRTDTEDDDHVFVDEYGRPIQGEALAEKLRDYLEAAGVDRAALFETGPNRRRIRAHDLRATFVTLSLANGKTEAWVMDRTGHTTSQMLNKYRRAARSMAELGQGKLLPLDYAIPELRSEDIDYPTITPEVVGQDRLELSANGLRVRCSTN